MGYENRLYVVDYHKETNWAEVIAVFNLCNTGYRKTYCLFREKAEKIPEGFRMYPEGFRMYKVDSDDVFEKDNYGERLTFSSIDDTLAAIKDDEEYEHYRRFTPVIAFLESIKNENYRNLIVVNCGY